MCVLTSVSCVPFGVTCWFHPSLSLSLSPCDWTPGDKRKTVLNSAFSVGILGIISALASLHKVWPR